MLIVSRSPQIQLVLRVLLLTLAYIIAGRLSLLLAIPPGFVTGIFLPLGIGLGALLIWGLPMVAGVVLGSTLLNIWIAVSAGQALNPGVVLVASEIACGSGLACLVGALLIRHLIGFPDNLTDERKIFLFFILGGPVATCVSASIGASTLYLNGIISVHQFFYTWWTWWIGDAIGVLIAAPLMCILFAEPRHFWRNRLTTVAIPLLVSSLLVVIVFILASTNEQRKIENEFEQDAQLVSSSIQEGLSSVEFSLLTLSGLFVASNNVSQQEFSSYVHHVFSKKTGISGLSWNQYVLNSERERIEAEWRESGFSHFSIKEKDDAGQLTVAAERKDYVVISYIEPWQKNAIVHGVNVNSDPVRADALLRARNSGSFSITEPLQLLQDQVITPSVLAFYPVFSQPTEVAEVALKGYVTAIVRTNELITQARKQFKKEHFHLRITDVTVPDEVDIFFDDGPITIPAYARGLSVKDEIVIGGRRLYIDLHPTEKFLAQHVSLQSWFVLAGGLLFSSLLGGFLLLISGRTQHVIDLVEQRTKELAAILESAVESILVVDDNGMIQKANPAAEKLFLVSQYQLVNQPIGQLIPSLKEIFSREGNTYEEMGNFRDAVAVTREGVEVPIEMSISCVDVQSRRLFTFIIHDVTERRKVDRMKTEFISTVSHELRTPLTSIKGALGIILSGSLGDISIKIEDLLLVAKRNTDRLTRLVNDILDIDKFEYNQMQLHLAPCTVYPLLQQAVEQNQGYANRYDIRLLLDDADDDLRALCANLDTDRFLQVMSNLISNAIKFSYKDGLVRVRLERDSIMFRIAVIDQGQGIPEDFRSRIFQKFAQVDSSDTRHRDGTGLGLSITKIIVERLGGSIDYESVPGKGTVFYVKLPIAASPVV